MQKYQIQSQMLYAGIGARNVKNENYAVAMRGIATRLATRGWTLRSGSATGSDTHFENGCDLARGSKEIYVPWAGFSGRFPPNVIVPSKMDEAMEIAAQHHPKWKDLSKGVKSLLARNVTIILGDNLKTPVKFVVAYTDQGKMEGGTSHAMRVAMENGIEILNIGDPFMRAPYAIHEALVKLTHSLEKQLEAAQEIANIANQEKERIARINHIDRQAFVKG